MAVIVFVKFVKFVAGFIGHEFHSAAEPQPKVRMQPQMNTDEPGAA